jgi:hypothetical protein
MNILLLSITIHSGFLLVIAEVGEVADSSAISIFCYSTNFNATIIFGKCYLSWIGWKFAFLRFFRHCNLVYSPCL